MKKNFEGVKAKLRERASAHFPQDIEAQDKYVQGELNKISYYDPKYAKAKEIIEANAEIVFPRDTTIIIGGKDKNQTPREQYVLDKLAELMAQLPRVDALRDMFFKEAVEKYPNYKIDAETGKKVPLDAVDDWMVKRQRPTQHSDYVRDHVNRFDFWKNVKMPKKLTVSAKNKEAK